MSQRFATDVLIIGGGAAGLAAALQLADAARVTVLSKGDITTVLRIGLRAASPR